MKDETPIQHIGGFKGSKGSCQNRPFAVNKGVVLCEINKINAAIKYIFYFILLQQLFYFIAQKTRPAIK